MMKIKTFIDERYDGNCYVVLKDKEAIIIDPSVPKQKLKLEKEVKIVAILITHAHFDHIVALDSYLDGEVPVYLHPYASEKLANPLKNLSYFCRFQVAVTVPKDLLHFTQDGKQYLLAGLECKIIHTSGHSNCSQCIILNKVIFTGDTLFKNNVGRTDLPTGNSPNLKESLIKLANLEGDYYLYPGHGEATTLAWERKTNPYLRGEKDV